jgi:hypothetical protein
MGKEIKVNRETAYEVSGIVTGIRVETDRIEVTRSGLMGNPSMYREYLPGQTRTFITVAPWNIEVQIYDTDQIDVEP